MNKILNFQVLLWSSLLLCVTSSQAATTTGIYPVGDNALTEFVQNAVSKHPQVLAEMASVDSRSALERAAGKAIYNPELEVDAESTADDT
jgi:hypothetical protein